MRCGEHLAVVGVWGGLSGVVGDRPAARAGGAQVLALLLGRAIEISKQNATLVKIF